MAQLDYALIVNPLDIETPVEGLTCHVYAKLNGYEGEILRSARRLPDRHAPAGHGFLVGERELETLRARLVVVE